MARVTNRLLFLSLLIASLVPALSGCGSDGLQDLRDYVGKVKSRQKGRVEPLPEIQTFESFFYAPEALRDPFIPAEQPVETTVSAADNGIRPDANRRREELETFALDTLRMVGTIDQQAEAWAIIAANNGTIHRVQVGNYLGLNHGRITQISENTIKLTEIVPDGLGGWRKRDASLALASEE